MTCDLCGAPRRRWLLFDRDGAECGRYCTKDCATRDAVGPRFRTFRVGRARCAMALIEKLRGGGK